MHTASGATPNSQKVTQEKKELTWLSRESGVEAEAVRSTRGTGVVRSTEGAAAAAALEPAMSAAAAAPDRGYFDWSSSSVRLEVISITVAGEVVRC